MTDPSTSQSPRTTGRGHPYRPEIVAAARTLVEGTELRLGEIAARLGVGEATVGIWSRRHRWRRPDGAPARRSVPKGIGDEAAVETPMRPLRSPGNPGPETRAAARALIEGTRLGFEAIGLRLGIATATVIRWKKRGGWQRPPRPERPHLPRSRTRRGRPYSTDAVETARQLVITSHLSQAYIAAQAGVAQATISKWSARRGWARPAPPAGSRYTAARRTAPLAETGDRRGRPYDRAVMAAARELYLQSDLPTANIAARVKVGAPTVARWARQQGWTRPRDMPDVFGRFPKRRRVSMTFE